jgi:hypothetical protein
MAIDIGICQLWHSVNMYHRKSRIITYLAAFRGRLDGDQLVQTFPEAGGSHVGVRIGNASKYLGSGSSRRTSGRRDNGDDGLTAR